MTARFPLPVGRIEPARPLPVGRNLALQNVPRPTHPIGAFSASPRSQFAAASSLPIGASRERAIPAVDLTGTPSRPVGAFTTTTRTTTLERERSRSPRMQPHRQQTLQRSREPDHPPPFWTTTLERERSRSPRMQPPPPQTCRDLASLIILRASERCWRTCM